MESTTSLKNEYWSTAREPWPSLLFILPFLIVYEVGALVHAQVPASRNGADLWLRQFGGESGIGLDWIFPLLAPLLLLTWQFIARRPWKWNIETLSGMFAESLLFAMLLVLLGQFIAIVFPLPSASLSMRMETLPLVSTNQFPRTFSFLGAGIYEEMLFRLTIMPLIFLSLRLAQFPKPAATVTAVIGSSALFAIAHYVQSPALFAPGEIWQAIQLILNYEEYWFSFTFRFLAGVLFAVLFWFRGFGIAVGCHILYDLFVGVVLAGV